VASFERSYRVLSYGFRIDTAVPAVGERLDGLLARFRVGELDGDAARYEIAREASTGLLVVDRDGSCVQRARTEAAIVDFVLWDAVTRAVERATDLLALHAGAVALDGRGVLLPAPPDSGKTTLTAALTRSGFSYLSDEVAPIDPETALLLDLVAPPLGHFYARRPHWGLPALALRVGGFLLYRRHEIGGDRDPNLAAVGFAAFVAGTVLGGSTAQRAADARNAELKRRLGLRGDVLP